MIELDDLDAMRAFLQGAPRRCTTAAAAGWLAGGGLPDHGASAPRTGGVTVIAFGDDTDLAVAIYAVPDGAIDAPLRAALAAGSGRTFAYEDVCDDSFAGPLWLLALCGKFGEGELRHLATSVPAVDVEALVAARAAAPFGAWDAHAIDCVDAIRGADVTACYTARLAH